MDATVFQDIYVFSTSVFPCKGKFFLAESEFHEVSNPQPTDGEAGYSTTSTIITKNYFFS